MLDDTRCGLDASGFYQITLVDVSLAKMLSFSRCIKSLLE